MKKMSTALVAGLATLAFSATAFAAISAEEAKAIAAKEVPASSTHIVTKADRDNLTPYFEVKFYDNATNTEYEIEVLQSTGAIKEYSMDIKPMMGSHKVVLSADDAKNVVLKDYPQATFTKVKLDSDDGLYEYEVKFTAAGLRGSYTINPETGVVYEKELKYQF